MPELVILILLAVVLNAVQKKKRPGGSRGTGPVRSSRPTVTPVQAEHREKNPAQPIPNAEGKTAARDYSKPEPYIGSLGVDSLEGIDICDESLGHSDTHPLEVLPDEEETAEVPCFFSKEALLQGIVMKEILARPSYPKR